MSVEALFENFFKPEVRKRGREDFAKGLAVMSVAGDAQIQGYVKGSTVAKVSFVAKDIANPTFHVDCSCPQSSRGTFCKHIWAMLLVVEQKHPDFLDSKTNIEKVSRFADVESPFKAKQSDFKKQQYQKQKERAKEWRQQIKDKEKGKTGKSTSYPQDVVDAFRYFSENGFPLEEGLSEESLRNAKKILSRVFHPDKGGSHEETVTLNQNCAILLRFLG